MVFKVNHLVYKTNNFYVLNTMNNFSTSGEYYILIRAIVHSVSLFLREIFRILSRPTEFFIGFFLPEMVLLRFESEFFLLLEIKILLLEIKTLFLEIKRKFFPIPLLTPSEADHIDHRNRILKNSSWKNSICFLKMLKRWKIPKKQFACYVELKIVIEIEKKWLKSGENWIFSPLKSKSIDLNLYVYEYL